VILTFSPPASRTIDLQLLLLLQRSLLPGGIILQGVLLLPGFYERFCVPLRLGANWGYWPRDSVFDQRGGVHHKLLMFLTWVGSFACHWHRHQVQGSSVLRLIRRTRAIEVKQLERTSSTPSPASHEEFFENSPQIHIS
jgi:hypothetical protein